MHNKKLFDMRAKDEIDMEKDDQRVILFSLFSYLYDVEKLKTIAGKRYDTDMLLYQLSKHDELLLNNLKQVIDVETLQAQYDKVIYEFEIVKRKEELMGQIAFSKINN